MSTQNSTSDSQKWGHYAVPKEASILLAMVKSGMARGTIGRWIRANYLSKFPSIVDSEIRNIKYRLNIADNPTDAKVLLSSKEYDNPELHYLSKTDGNVFLDIGANTGYYSLTLAQRGFSKILAIEPNPVTLKRLEYNIQLNDFAKVITVVPLCIGEGGDVPFYFDESNLGSASLHQIEQGLKPFMVPSKPLVDIVKEAGIDKIDGLKIDIEGYEDKALLPFFEQSPKSLWPTIIVMEDCNQTRWETDIYQYLLDGKYQLVKKTRGNAIIEKIA